jgi:tetratricopeptide (TPR) repeat protein
MNASTLAGLLLLTLFSTPFAIAQSAPDATDSVSDLDPGIVRHALALGHSNIAQHPKDAAAYIRLAYSLTDAGINDEAVEVARKGTQADPHSAVGYSGLAWVLSHNSIGVMFGKGMDYDAAIAAYRKAIELNSADLDVRGNLADLLEHDRNGNLYSPESHLSDAIDTLRYIKAHQCKVETHTEDNLVIDLFYAGKFKEVLPELSNAGPSSIRYGTAVAAIAATEGASAAIAYADQIGGDEQNKKDALTTGAEGLWNMRLYSQAAALLKASLPNPSESREIIGQIQIFNNLRPYPGPKLPATDPRSPVERLLASLMTGSFTESSFEQNLSSHAFSGTWQSNSLKQQTQQLAGAVATLSKQTGLPFVVVQDIVLGTLKLNIVPSDEPGSRVLAQTTGSPLHSFFVIKEDVSFKIAGTSDTWPEVGTEALYLMQHQQEEQAKSLLDWKRDLTHEQDENDPLGRPLFARLWTVGKSSDRQSIELAAASLLTDKSTLLTLLPDVVAARKQASTDGDRDNLDLLLASIYLSQGDSKNANLTTAGLLDREPDSAAVVALAGRAYALTKDWPAWKSLLTAKLQRRPDDRPLLLQSVAEAEAEGDLPRARQALKSILDTGRGQPEDYNLFAWLSLFDQSVDDKALDAAQQVNMTTNNTNYAYLHTLACLDAARGNTTEAKQLLLEAMKVGNLQEPNDAIWYGFGLIYEQYGDNTAAIAAYTRVKNEASKDDPIGPYVLAQRRLEALH